MSIARHQRAVLNLGGFAGGTSRLARPPAVLPDIDIRPTPERLCYLYDPSSGNLPDVDGWYFIIDFNPLDVDCTVSGGQLHVDIATAGSNEGIHIGRDATAMDFTHWESIEVSVDFTSGPPRAGMMIVDRDGTHPYAAAFVGRTNSISGTWQNVIILSHAGGSDTIEATGVDLTGQHLLRLELDRDAGTYTFRYDGDAYTAEFGGNRGVFAFDAIVDILCTDDPAEVSNHCTFDVNYVEVCGPP